MKCPSCGEKYISSAKFCSACGDKLQEAPFKRKVLMRAKIWLTGGLTGMGTGLSFILVHDALTTDLIFDLWEFGVALVAPGIIAIIVAKTTSSKIVVLLAIAYLTLLIPVLGTSFGASGTEPWWQFAVIGCVGGLVWSLPFAILDPQRTSAIR